MRESIRAPGPLEVRNNPLIDGKVEIRFTLDQAERDAQVRYVDSGRQQAKQIVILK